MNPVIKKIALVLLATSYVAISYGQCDPVLQTDSAEILFDGAVNKMVVHDQYMYAGGNFKSVGQYSGSFIEIDRKTGRAVNRIKWPKVKGPSNVITDGGGNYIVFGSFDSIGHLYRPSIGIINAAMQLTPFSVSINGAINAAVIYGGKLYIGGDFTMINGSPRNRLASIDLSNGMLMPWEPNVNNTGPLPCRIECMVLNGTNLYIGGAFSDIGATPRKNIAVLDIITGIAGSWAPQAYFAGNPNYGNVSKMLRVNNRLYICGGFDFVGGSIHGDVAAIDLTTGLSTTWAPNPNSAVLSLANKGDTLYLGGAFFQISGLPRQGFAAYSIASGSLLPIAINTKKVVNERIYSILAVGDTIYLGGSFDTINNQERKNLAAFNRFTGTILPWTSHTNSDVTGLLNDNGKLLATGRFYSVGRKIRNFLAAIDLDADTVAPWESKINGEILSMNLRKDVLYVSGYFSKFRDSARLGNAALDLKKNIVLSWDPKAKGIIRDIEFYKNDVYISGDFDTVDGQLRHGLAKLDTVAKLQPWIGTGTVRGEVNTLDIYKDTMYVGGIFDTLAGKPKRNLGAVNLVSGGLASFDGNYFDLVRDTGRLLDIENITASFLKGDTLYVAGKYNVLDTILNPLEPKPIDVMIRTNVVIRYRLNPIGKQSLVIDTCTILLRKFDLPIHDLYVDADGKIYVVGEYSHVENDAYSLTCILAVPTQSPLAFNPMLKSQSVNTICIAGNKMFMGGTIGELSREYEGAVMFYLPYMTLTATIVTDTNGVCSGIPVTVRANSSISYGESYHWNVNGVGISNPLSYYTSVPTNKDSISCVVTVPANGCLVDMYDTTNSIVFYVTPTVTPDISITSVIEEESGKQVTVKATVKDAATGYSIEWFNKGVSIGKTTVDTFNYIKGAGTDSIYAVITPRPDTCYVTDTSGLIVVNEKPVGIGNITGDARVTVYPNPFDTYVKVSGLERGNLLILYDVTGRKISTATSTSKEDYLLETGKLKAGVYVLKITDCNGMLRKSILIQKQ